jgi:hypothetical protein
MTDNCQLGEKMIRQLEFYYDLVPDRDYDVYIRNELSQPSCQPTRTWDSGNYTRCITQPSWACAQFHNLVFSVLRLFRTYANRSANRSVAGAIRRQHRNVNRLRANMFTHTTFHLPSI